MDWNKEWKNTRESTGHNDDVEFWNEFAPRFRKDPGPGEKDMYAEAFYEKAGIKSGETIFDMGCASGTLAIPFAQKGHEVYAADFSPRMLEILEHDAKKFGLSDLIHPMQLDWNEDWSLREIPVCDVAISSRSLIADDVEGCLKKLETKASRKVCVGVWTTGRYGYDRRIAEEIGYNKPDYGVFVYIMNILFDMNKMPELLYIPGIFKSQKYDSFEDCIQKVSEKFPEKLTKMQQQKLAEYTKHHLIKEDGLWHYDHDGMATWAFISWDK